MQMKIDFNLQMYTESKSATYYFKLRIRRVWRY